MDEPIGSNTPETLGNTDIPDWMQKRRAKLALASGRDTSAPAAARPASDPAVISLDVKSGQSEVDTVKDLASPRTGAPETPKPPPLPAKRTVAAGRAAFKLDQTLTPKPATESTWYDDFRRDYLNKDALRSYAVSLFTHLMIAIPLSIVVFRADLNKPGINGVFDTAGNGIGSDGIDGTSVFEVEPPGGSSGEKIEEPESLDTMLAASAVTDALGPSSLNLTGDVGAQGAVSGGKAGSGGSGEGEGEGVGDGLNLGGFKMPAGGRAVKKGSFTAWTVPEDPEPGEDYKIIIQVKYAKPNQKIPPNDITGSIIGTDKFRLMISKHTSEIITEANQVVIYIPGARARVRDSIRVYSAMLKENQHLEITF